MKCWNSAFNAQGLRLIIVVVQVRAVEALEKKERQDEIQFTTKIDGFMSFVPIAFNANVLFCRFFWISPCMTKLRVPVLCFSYFMDNSSVFRLVLCYLCLWLRFKKVSWHDIHLLALSRAAQHHRLVVWMFCEGVHQAVMLGEVSVFNWLSLMLSSCGQMEEWWWDDRFVAVWGCNK